MTGACQFPFLLDEKSKVVLVGTGTAAVEHVN